MNLLNTIPYRPTEMALLSALILERTGNHYPADKYDLLASKLERLLWDLGLTSFMDLYYRLKYDNEPSLWQQVQNALAVNETYFWREFTAIQAAVEELIPAWQAQWPGRTLRIWHAACASGEEPYTMAIALLEAGLFDKGPIEILGTDFNTAALARARSGLYRQSSMRALPAEILEKYFTRLEHPIWHYSLAPAVRNRVRFQYLNLVDTDAIYQLGRMDLIFCRNVFIYFSEEVIRKVASALAQALEPHGLLFTSTTESLLRISHHFELVPIGQAYGYRKVL